MTQLPPWCDDARVFSLPMTMRFRGITTRHGMLLHGPEGWAEWAPFAEYDADEAATWLAAAREAATQPDPTPVRDAVPVNVTVPACSAERAHEIVRQSGCHTAKVKVAGTTLPDDLARVEAVRDAIDTGAVRVDANGAWGLDEALRAIRELARFDLEYVEQPVADVEDLARVRIELVRRGIAVRVAADESIRRASDPERVRELEAADVAVVKVAPLGGVRTALRIAETLGLPTVVSSALDSSIGLRQGVMLAATLPELPFACGLNTARLLARDTVVTPIQADAGTIRMPERLEPLDPDDFPTADASTRSWWFDRLAAAWAVLASRDAA